MVLLNGLENVFIDDVMMLFYLTLLIVNISEVVYLYFCFDFCFDKYL